MSHPAIGYLASLLVLATFCMRDMVTLRAVAIASNVAFIAYGWVGGSDPVLVLHLVLLPTNVWHLLQARRQTSVDDTPWQKFRQARPDGR